MNDIITRQNNWDRMFWTRDSLKIVERFTKATNKIKVSDKTPQKASNLDIRE